MSKEANQSKRRYFPLRDASNPYKVTLVEITEARTAKTIRERRTSL